MNGNIYSTLIYKYLQGTATDEETTLLLNWAQENPEHQQLLDELANEEKLAAALQAYHPLKREELENRIYQRIKNQIAIPVNNIIPFYKKPIFKISIAAAVLAFVGLFFIFNPSKNKSGVLDFAQKDVKAPISNMATITLANGATVLLDSVANGDIAMQGNIQIIKNADGTISYHALNNAENGVPVFNTLSNPVGSKPVDISLADGSRVWLNAESSITFPVAFQGKQRKVSMQGEAYFEVAHNAAKPFLVQHNKTEVQVLGTHFNINAYDDDATTQVTLLEGSVKVNTTNSQQLLRPMQQAQINDNNGSININSDINIDEIMAWKSGEFVFDRSNIYTVMRMLGRWYDISYEIKEPIAQHFGGTISRDVPLSKVIQMLELTGGVTIKKEGNKLFVMSKEK